MKNLSESKRKILKQIILENPNRPQEINLNDLYNKMDYSKYPEAAFANDVEDLVEAGFLSKQEGNEYIFSRDQFIQAKSYFKKSILLHNQLVQLFIPIFVAIIAGGAALLASYFTESNSGKINEVIAYDKVKSIEQKLMLLDSLSSNLGQVPDSIRIALNLEQMRKQISNIGSSVNAFNRNNWKKPYKIN